MTEFPDKKTVDRIVLNADIRTAFQGAQLGLTCGTFLYIALSLPPVFLVVTLLLMVLCNIAERVVNDRSGKALMAAYRTWYASKVIEDEKQSLAGVIREGLLPYSVKMVPARPYPDQGWDYE